MEKDGEFAVTEAELIQLAQQGDQDAFAQLVKQNEKRIYALTLRLCGNQEDALDLAQETFLNAWRGLASFKGDSSFYTWLYRLASNACIDYLRRYNRRLDLENAQSLDDEEHLYNQPEDRRFDPQSELEKKELQRALRQGLNELSDEHRHVLVLRELWGYSYQEIASTLELDLGTVKSRIARARLALRKILIAGGNFSVTQPSILTERQGKE